MKRSSIIAITLVALVITTLTASATHVYAQPMSYPTPGVISKFFYGWNDDGIGLDSSLHSLDGIINKLVPLLIVFAGVILLLMLIAGGFQLLTSAANPDQAEAGKKRITVAIIGFLVILMAYWIIQILEVFLGIRILRPNP